MHSYQRQAGLRSHRREFTPTRPTRPVELDENTGKDATPLKGGQKTAALSHATQELKFDATDQQKSGVAPDALSQGEGAAGAITSVAESKGIALVGRLNTIMTGLMTTYRTKEDDQPELPEG